MTAPKPLGPRQPPPGITILYPLLRRRWEESLQFGIHDTRDAIDGVVMLADRKTQQLVNDDARQINGAALEGAIS